MILIILNLLKDFLLKTQLVESAIVVDGAPAAATNRFKLHRY